VVTNGASVIEANSDWASRFSGIPGSPHLNNADLRVRMERLVVSALRSTPTSSPRVLEIGGGHGMITSFLLAEGASVTATEAAQARIDELRTRFADDDRVRVVDIRNEQLDPADRFDVIVAISVLHHVPDYEALVVDLIDRHLVAGGAFVSFQDPLWYPRLRRRDHVTDRLGYYLWRLTIGDLRSGIKTVMNRMRHGVTEDAAADIVEYHVVRSGVDEERLRTVLGERFGSVRIDSYWSNQLDAVSRLCTRLKLVSNFGLSATGHNARRANS
jgi:SAM-dependent methyltransferase